MPRKARLLVPNCPHHIVQRGHNRSTVFAADEDYKFYLENLNEWKTKLGVKVYAYCLMTNHVHLVVEPEDDPSVVSELMKRLAGRQSAYVNKLEKRTGSLWEGRFKASPIQRNRYLLGCCRYVDLNPVAAKMVVQAQDYRWSSYRFRVGLADSDFLDRDRCFLKLGNSLAECQQRYKEFVEVGCSKEQVKLFHNTIQRNQLSGTERFAREIEAKIGRRIKNRGRGRPRKIDLSP
ncbi:transposase [Kangiella sp. TOML190]|uniref:transposase n=1 Tax=Kangiella sp. TOML190 TaxID=2931351 RepID=UPI00203E1BDF|nr:transposase [Kangiella sp. TOML190]